MMMPTTIKEEAPVPPPAYHRVQARLGPALHINALTLVTMLHLLALCRVAVRLAHHRCPPPLAAGPGGAPRRYREESLLLIALLRTLWRLSYQDMHDWLRDWPALALAADSRWTTRTARSFPARLNNGSASIRQVRRCQNRSLLLTVLTALRRRVMSARDLIIIDSVPIVAWRRADPDAAVGHAPAQHPRPLSRGYRIHTLICRGSGLPLFFLLSPANVHDAPFAQPLLAWAVQFYRLRPRVIRLDAAYWGLRLIAWIHGVLGAVEVIPWNPKRQKNRSCLPPTWTKEELGLRSSIERFFGRVFLFFHLQRPPLAGWSTVTRQIALTYTATVIVGLAAQHAGRPDLIRSPKQILAHLWEGL